MQQTVTKIETPLAQTTPFLLSIPPKASLRGTLVSRSGDIDWQAREATEPAVLSEGKTVLQGEEYWTGENGSLEIVFPTVLRVLVHPQTHISFIQTLPTNFVMLQESGKITYTKADTTTPVAIRAVSLLVAQKSGEATISIDEETAFITIVVKKGSVTIAFNDGETVSHVITVEEGYSYTFDNDQKEGELTVTDG